MNFSLFIFVALVVVLAASTAECANINTPIVGILSQPSSSEIIRFGKTYIAASYVKWAESAGAQVVPIKFDSTQEELEEVFNQVNAIIFPGGGSSLDNTTLYDAGEYLYNLAIQANDNGDYFPLFGHCMGFELLNIITSQDFDILDGIYDAENISMPLHFTNEGLTSKYFADADGKTIHILANEEVCMNNHQYGVSFDTFASTPLLNNFYNILSWNVDREGAEFISTIEAKDYPIYGIQWHAEKPQFEWNVDEAVNHNNDAIYAMQHFSRFLGSEARKNMHTYSSQEALNQALIYNYEPVYTEAYDSSFEQCYFFD